MNKAFATWAAGSVGRIVMLVRKILRPEELCANWVFPNPIIQASRKIGTMQSSIIPARSPVMCFDSIPCIIYQQLFSLDKGRSKQGLEKEVHELIELRDRIRLLSSQLVKHNNLAISLGLLLTSV